MTAAFDIVLPMFALMLCGYGAARSRLFGADAVKGIANFVFFFAIPALLFRGISRAAVAGDAEFAIVFAYFAGCLLLFAASMAVGRLAFGLALREQAVMGFTATFSNTVLLGIPLIYAAFGEAGLLPVTLITSFHSIILLTLATLIIELGAGAGRHLLRAVPQMLAALLRNPLLLAILAGFIARGFGWQMPAVLDRATSLFAAAAAPCSLFALGATLAGFRISGDPAQSAVLVIAKMVVHPLIVWALATQIFALSPIQVAVATILAALPSGANAFILAERYGVYVERTATAILVTTALSIVTAALLVAHYAPPR
ncbi:MAG TPA: AEC family transporter [Stellaceae bacterium]|nr:AEC family transporter [Stellaceae bacterium]